MATRAKDILHRSLSFLIRSITQEIKCRCLFRDTLRGFLEHFTCSLPSRLSADLNSAFRCYRASCPAHYRQDVASDKIRTNASALHFSLSSSSSGRRKGASSEHQRELALSPDTNATWTFAINLRHVGGIAGSQGRKGSTRLPGQTKYQPLRLSPATRLTAQSANSCRGLRQQR